MSWIEFDFLGSESMESSMAARDLVLQVFVTSTNTLESEWDKYRARETKRSAQTTDEGELGFASQEMDWAEQQHRRRMQAIGALALDWLMSLLQETLHGSQRYFA